MDACENAVAMVTELENYLLCSVTKTPCNFQRYCISREEAINTEGSKSCRVKTKIEKKVLNKPEDNAKETIPAVEDFQKEKINKIGTVTLVTNSYVVYDYNGNSCFKQGHFNLKIGDKIEL